MPDIDVNMFITNMKLANTVAKQQVLICDMLKKVIDTMNGKADNAEVTSEINNLKTSIENISNDLENCVTKLPIDTVPKAYVAQEDTGKVIGLEITQGPTNYSIAQRDGQGHLKCTSPTYEYDTTNKAYVDSKLRTKVNSSTYNLKISEIEDKLSNKQYTLYRKDITEQVSGYVACYTSNVEAWKVMPIINVDKGPTDPKALVPYDFLESYVAKYDNSMPMLPDDVSDSNFKTIVGNNVTTDNYYDEGKHLSGKHNYKITNESISFNQVFTLDADFQGTLLAYCHNAGYSTNIIRFMTGSRTITIVNETSSDISNFIDGLSAYKYGPYRDNKQYWFALTAGYNYDINIIVTKTSVLVVIQNDI